MTPINFTFFCLINVEVVIDLMRFAAISLVESALSFPKLSPKPDRVIR